LLRSTDEKSRLGYFPSILLFLRDLGLTDEKVVEEITKEQLKKKIGDRKNSLFLEDPAIPAKFRAKLSDYFRSGYDRGHQVLSRKYTSH
jgi:DNA/RNA endonuclease G (NUC1)